jgi:hypothetical protein
VVERISQCLGPWSRRAHPRGVGATYRIAPELSFSLRSMVTRCESGARAFVHRGARSGRWTVQIAWHIISHGARGVGRHGFSPNAVPPDLRSEECYGRYSSRPRPRYPCLVTEDDTPVDNIASEKHQRLLTEAAHGLSRNTSGLNKSAWRKNRPCNNSNRSASGPTGWRPCCDSWDMIQSSFDNHPAEGSCGAPAFTVPSPWESVCLAAAGW